jgi:hypothetical protein
MQTGGRYLGGKSKKQMKQEQQIEELARARAADEAADVLGETYVRELMARGVEHIDGLSMGLTVNLYRKAVDLADGDPYLIAALGDLFKTGQQKLKANVRESFE